MRRRLALLSAVLLVAACNQARVVEDASYAGAALPRPDRILVYDFAAAPQDVRLDQGIRARIMRVAGDQPPSSQQMAAIRKTTSALTGELVRKLRDYGLPAEAAFTMVLTGASTGNIVTIQGQIVSVDEGNRTRRTLIGLGAGKSSVEADAQVFFHRGANPPQLIESMEANADSGHAPGAAETMGAGAAAGRLATATATTAGMHAVSERRSAGDDDNANRIARGLALKFGQFSARQGWIPANVVR